MKKENFYELLGVPPEATQDEIRKAYHLLARKLHPDVAKEEGDFDKFKEITAAYDTLSDPEARAQYNKENDVILRGPGNTQHSAMDDRDRERRPREEPPVPPPDEDRPVVELQGGLGTSKTAFKDLQRRLAKQDDLRVGQRVAMTDPSQIAGEEEGEEEIAPWAGGDAAPKKRFDWKSLIKFGKGGNKEATVLKEFSDAVGARNMDYLRDQQRRQLMQNNVMPADEELKRRKRELLSEQRPDTAAGGATVPEAPAAERVYQFQVTDYEAMLGSSREIAVPDPRDEGNYSRIKVKIPAGIKDGTKMQASRGWTRMAFKVAISPDPYYSVQGDNIFVKLPISLQEAVFGALAPVRTPHGKVVVKVKQGSTYSNPIVMSGRGMQPQGRDPGDLYALPYIVFPSQELELVRENLGRLKDSYTQTALSGVAAARENASGVPFADVYSIPITIPEVLNELTISGSTGGARFSFKLDLNWDGEALTPSWQGSAPGYRILPVLVLPDVNETVLADVGYRLGAASGQSPRSRMIVVDV